MIYENIDIKNAASMEYARLELFALKYTEEMPIGAKRPLVLVCPGGGYVFTSQREAEPIAMKYLAAGFHVAVLWYSVAPAVFPTALLEVAKAFYYLRENADRYHIDTERMAVAGFSAGGHLAASYGMFWSCDFVCDGIGVARADREMLKPNGMILSYPVITGGEFAHSGSIHALTGENGESLDSPALKEIAERIGIKGELTRELAAEAFSLEKQVSEDTPKAFIWHTQTDGSVPVENSLMLAAALQRQGINYEMHIYPNGGHGLSLANELTMSPHASESFPECRNWIDMAITWINLRLN